MMQFSFEKSGITPNDLTGVGRNGRR